MGHHKLTVGLEYNLMIIEPNEAIWYEDAKRSINYNPNFKANYGFYFTNKYKRVTQFISVNFNTQKIKDYTTSNIYDFEYKKGYAIGMGYGATFLIKKHFLLEPSLIFNTSFFRDKNIYKYSDAYQIYYTTDIRTSYVMYAGINLKLAYIIPFKKKEK